jgi:hypothetical protein
MSMGFVDPVSGPCDSCLGAEAADWGAGAFYFTGEIMCDFCSFGIFCSELSDREGCLSMLFNAF